MYFDKRQRIRTKSRENVSNQADITIFVISVGNSWCLSLSGVGVSWASENPVWDLGEVVLHDQVLVGLKHKINVLNYFKNLKYSLVNF